MMDLKEYNQSIENFLAGKPINKENREKTAVLLWDYYKQTNDAHGFCNNLLKFPYEVAEIIFRNNAGIIDAAVLNTIIRTIEQDTLFLDNKNDISFGVACVVFSVFIQNENSFADICRIFKKALSIAEKKKGFSEKCVKIFSRLILDNSVVKTTLFKINLLEWERHDRDRIYKFVKFLETKNILSLTSQEMKKWVMGNKFELPDRITVIEETLTNLQKICNGENSLQIIEMLKQNIDSVKHEMEDLRRKLNDSYRMNFEIESENTRLRKCLSQKENECLSLSSETKKQAIKISELEKQNAALKNDLGGFAKMADAAQKDELFTLKNDIKAALKSEYEKYAKTKNSEYTEGLFEAFKGRFFRIFATLKDFGISFEEDA
jgi:regulator of replication initiation timing